MSLVLFCFIIILPFLYGLERLSILPFSGVSHYVALTLYTIAAAFALYNLIQKAIARKLVVELTSNKLRLFVVSLFFIAIVIAHIFDNSNIKWSIMGIQRIAMPMILFLWILTLPDAKFTKIIERGIPIFTVACFIFSIIGIVEYILLKAAFSQINTIGDSIIKLRAIRIGSVFNSPLFFGMVLYYGLVANFWWLLKRPYNPILLLMFVTNCVALWYTFSRGPMVIFAVFLALYIILSPKSGMRTLNYLVLFLLISVAAVVFRDSLSNNSVLKMFSSSVDFEHESSNELRARFWIHSENEIFKDAKSIVWGYGIGRTGALPTVYNFPGGFPPESWFLFLWLEIGIVGLGTYLILFCSILAASVSKLVERHAIGFLSVPNIAAIAFIAVIPELVVLQFPEVEYLANLVWIHGALCLVAVPATIAGPDIQQNKEYRRTLPLG